MWVKICGITRNEDAEAAFTAGADAIGLNFFPGSKRFVSVPVAAQITAALHATAAQDPEQSIPETIGVFVNADLDTVTATARSAGLSGIQFHGDEHPSLIEACMAQLPGLKVIRAFRVSAERLDATLAEIDLLSARLPLHAVLLDAFVAGEYGGTGHQVDAGLLSAYCSGPRPRLLLAGGLTPENIGAAVTAVGPWGVDTASGVECSPGIKDPRRIREFVRGARAAALQLQQPRD